VACGSVAVAARKFTGVIVGAARAGQHLDNRPGSYPFCQHPGQRNEQSAWPGPERREQDGQRPRTAGLSRIAVSSGTLVAGPSLLMRRCLSYDITSAAPGPGPATEGAPIPGESALRSPTSGRRHRHLRRI
jgi:hypothetical protein